MAGQFRFKNNSGTVVAQISASNAGAMSFSGSALDFSSVTTLTLGTTTLSGTASFATTAVSSSYGLNALTGSNAMTASSADTLYVRNNATVLGSITAQTLIVQTVTSSVLFTTGSNIIGSSLSNTQELTGSVGITGSLSVNTNGIEFQVSAGGVNIGNALIDNHVISGSLTVNPNGLFVSSSGNVGIGNVSPTVALDVTGAGKFSGVVTLNSNEPLILNRTNNTSTSNAIRFQTGGTTQWYVGSDYYLQSGTENFGFYNGSYKLTITSAGNVGIGTSSPSQKLEVYAGNYDGVKINATDVPSLFFYVQSGSQKNWGIATTNQVAGDFGIYQSNSNGGNPITAGTARLYITSGGNVGIGTSSPNGPLSVQANTGNTAIRLIGTSQSSSNNAGIYWYDSNDSTFNGYIGNFSGSFDIYNQRSTPMVFSTAATERMRITSGGNVLIGTTTEAAEANLSIGAKGTGEGAHMVLNKATNYTYATHLDNYQDEFRILYGTNTGSSGVNLSIKHPSGNYIFSGSNISDRRLKENINYLTVPAIEKLKQLVPKTYNMIANPETLRYGFIAQEVQEILPDLITGTESENDVLGLDYNGILTLAVKAIQELSAKVTLLENK